MEVNEIDALLERYLQLLHEYTTLRTELSNLQTGIYQNIARANFSAERGMRYGPDFYDERMQATRRIKVATSNGDNLSLKVASTEETTEPLGASSDAPKSEGREIDHSDVDDRLEETEMKTNQRPKRKDPLQWFGLLTPLPLRQAQGQSIRAVEQVIPRLISINVEMQQVEIEVRRARKKRAKAEAVAKKHQDGILNKELTA
ncbi:hypothetical protein AB5N19_12570 [Seiridium cardinale]|uniref:Vacuolar ATPase assembly protein VMA22 n=1 Tax=Seiridium cardinale TaxID=138064 RepID=A0ABR2XMI5_9PEZI